ncbi:pentapeptide repeat-containing protein [Aurantibacillus circumpalustris]|uniref:pentapeptide repeat-containing protein n=1 Tax=Aurantibacillus circumpalustris TaxID=3036359 RepID=UPI00295A8E48|nr:pentapeptide repeat-containing protein [Aurantibacillus circumpalustris]
MNFANAKDFGFEVHFENCNLDYASFDKKKMNSSTFKACKIHNGNFTQADLSKSKLDNCDFYEALFSNTNLSGVDLRSCHNFIIDPELNKIRRAKFMLSSLPSLLQRYEIIVENS